MNAILHQRRIIFLSMNKKLVEEIFFHRGNVHKRSNVGKNIFLKFKFSQFYCLCEYFK